MVQKPFHEKQFRVASIKIYVSENALFLYTPSEGRISENYIVSRTRILSPLRTPNRTWVRSLQTQRI
jgi:hypothetical protein